jgi:SAM-dependent methyltransferase
MPSNEKALKAFYEKDANRFWDPRAGLTGRDLVVYPLLDECRGRVLEYGCGSGSLLLNLALEDRFTECIGVDISEEALRKVADAWREMSRAAGVDRSKVKLMVPKEDKVPEIPNNSVEVVLILAVLEHVLDPYTVLDELYRVSKPGGKLVVAVPNYGYIKHIVQLLFNIQPITGGSAPVKDWRHTGWDGMHLHTFVKSSLETILTDCGWIPERWTGWGSRFSRIGLGLMRRRFPRLFSGELVVVCRKK